MGIESALAGLGFWAHLAPDFRYNVWAWLMIQGRMYHSGRMAVASDVESILMKRTGLDRVQAHEITTFIRRYNLPVLTLSEMEE